MLLLLLGCPNKEVVVDDSNEAEPWDLPASGFGDAMLLSAWSRGSEMLVVGGDLGEGGHGDLVHVYEGELCIEHAVAEAPLWWIHGQDQDFWAVGAQGTVLREVGGERSRLDIETDKTLYGVYDDGSHAWVVGGNPDEGTGALWRSDGEGGWELMLETEGVLFKVYGEHVIGDGQSWLIQGDELVEVGTQHRLVTVRGDGTTTTAVGGSSNALVVEWSGSDWVEKDASRLNGALNGVWTGAGETVWVAGNAGVMGRRSDDGSWEVPDFPLTSDAFHAVWKHEGEIWWVGGSFFSPPYHGTLGRYSEDPSPLMVVGDCD